MRRRTLVVSTAALLSVACTQEPGRLPPRITEVRLPLFTASPHDNNISVHLSGDGESPVRETLAQGQAILHIADDGTGDFKLVIGTRAVLTSSGTPCDPLGVVDRCGGTLRCTPNATYSAYSCR